MPKKSTLTSLQQQLDPLALIVGNGGIVDALRTALQERGCQVDVYSHHNFSFLDEEKLKIYSYIFLFTGFELETQLRKITLPQKTLFIESSTDALPFSDNHFKVVCIGDRTMWDDVELVELLLRMMFTSNPSRVLDVRRHSPIPLLPLEQDIPEKKVDLKEKTSPPVLAPHPKPLQVTVPKKKTFPSPIKKSHTHYKYVGSLLTCVCIIVIGVFSAGVFLYLQHIKQVAVNLRSHVASGSWEKSDQELDELSSFVERLHSFHTSATSLLPPLLQAPYVKDLGVTLDVSNNLLDFGNKGISFLRSRKLAFTSPGVLFSLPQNDFKESSALSLQALNELATSQQKLKDVRLPFLPLEDMKHTLDSGVEKLSALQQILPLAEQLLYTPQPKTYLVLFQNNMELRPTGGFIGSFGLLTIQNGAIPSFKIFDVYQADGQLKGHVDPPNAIRTHLAQPNWFLRDSNFDPDFALSADKAMWFLEKEINTQVDGVIGINLFFFQNILRVLGPLTITDFNNESVSADNFFFKSQLYKEESFFPGSTQKKDFLAAVMNSLQARLTHANVPWIDILQVSKNALDEKNIILFSKDPELQKNVESLGWGGRMSTIQCLTNQQQELSVDTSNCYADYLSINEANLGVNKANYFISKSVLVQKNIQADSSVQTQIQLAYENSSVPEVFHGGVYTNYLRLFIPAGSNLLSIAINDSVIAPSELAIEPYGGDKTSIGFLVKIAPKENKTIKVLYANHKKIDNSHYQFLYQKQGGDKTSPLVLSIHADAQVLKPVNFVEHQLNENSLQYSTDTSSDRIFAFNVEKK